MPPRGQLRADAPGGRCHVPAIFRQPHGVPESTRKSFERLRVLRVRRSVYDLSLTSAHRLSKPSRYWHFRNISRRWDSTGADGRPRIGWKCGAKNARSSSKASARASSSGSRRSFSGSRDSHDGGPIAYGTKHGDLDPFEHKGRGRHPPPRVPVTCRFPGPSS